MKHIVGLLSVLCCTLLLSCSTGTNYNRNSSGLSDGDVSRIYRDLQEEKFASYAETASAENPDWQTTAKQDKTPTIGNKQVSSCVSWTQAAKYVNQYICVQGTVTRTYKDPNSTAFFIDFDNSTTSFFAVSFKFRYTGLEGKCVQAIGLVRSYSNRTEIIIEDQTQLKYCP